MASVRLVQACASSITPPPRPGPGANTANGCRAPAAPRPAPAAGPAAAAAARPPGRPTPASVTACIARLALSANRQDEHGIQRSHVSVQGDVSPRAPADDQFAQTIARGTPAQRMAPEHIARADAPVEPLPDAPGLVLLQMVGDALQVLVDAGQELDARHATWRTCGPLDACRPCRGCDRSDNGASPPRKYSRRFRGTPPSAHQPGHENRRAARPDRPSRQWLRG